MAFNDATIIEPRLNRNFYTAVPGMATGAGLLCTFLAILVALLDVTLENEQFKGLDTLISGLSGKFLSSIAALSAATVYALFEKPLLHRMSQGVRHLVVDLDELVPHLTPARILLTIQQHMQAQSGAWQRLNTELATTLREGVNEGLGSTLERMVQPVEQLNQWLQTAESQRAKAAAGSMEGLLQQLGHSLTTTLNSMTERFTEALSHATSHQFESVATALNGSAQLLADMNAQFLTTQASLNNLVDLAKNSAAEQMALGKTQVEELTLVLRQLMSQMQETAGGSVNRMAAALTAVVHDLSSKVTEMSESMSQTVTNSTGQATEAAHAMIGKVDIWSAQSARQLEDLLERHVAHLDRVKDLQGTLEKTLVQFKSGLSDYAAVSTGLKSISAQTAAMVTAATTSMNNLHETGAALERAATMMSTQAERLVEANKQQEEIQRGMLGNLHSYQQIFPTVEQAASQLLQQIEQHLRQYTATTQQGFETLSQAANEHFANASRHLGDTVGDLDEHLQDLTEILERMGSLGGKNGRSK
jgi:hypothetical protein